MLLLVILMMLHKNFMTVGEQSTIALSIQTYYTSTYAWIRLNGEAVFENNMAAKEMCIQNPIVKGQYGEATNPIFEVFYLKNAHAVIADFSGNPPKAYEL
jgi:uncharacterized pyridoxamine 5'-phosphate oxidase family protein